jgi:hypothetical protein
MFLTVILYCVNVKQLDHLASLFISNSQLSCASMINCSSKRGWMSSLWKKKINFTHFGSFKNRTDKLTINQNVKWSFRKVKALGVWFSTNKEEAVMLNYQEKKEKISKILSCWQLRRLTLIGKVTVIKSLAASQLVYIMCHLRNLIWKKCINFCIIFCGIGEGIKLKEVWC